MGDTNVEAGAELLNQAQIPTFPCPDTAAQVFNYLWRYSENLRSLYETPVANDIATPNRTLVETLIQKTRQAGRTILTEESIYFCYFHLIKLSQRIAHDRLTRLCFIDYDREMAIVADYHNPDTDTHEILAVARLSKLHGRDEAEFALLVSDRYQCQGLGTQLHQQILHVGRDENISRITAETLRENGAMQRVCTKLGFRIRPTAASGVVKAEIDYSL
jgi:GNAT superfamily N-acetyltransferase